MTGVMMLKMQLCITGINWLLKYIFITAFAVFLIKSIQPSWAYFYLFNYKLVNAMYIDIKKNDKNKQQQKKL